VAGESFTLTPGELFDFSEHPDPRIHTFAGEVVYQTTIDLNETSWRFLDLGIEKQVTEVILNGEKIGTRWWGRHLYRVEPDHLLPGENRLEIIYTTTLANYVNSLEENRVAKRWIRMERPESMGFTGEVRLLKSR
jgi:hypothetical protein